MLWPYISKNNFSITTHLILGLTSGLSPSSFLTENCKHFTSLLCCLSSLPTSYSFWWPTKQCIYVCVCVCVCVYFFNSVSNDIPVIILSALWFLPGYLDTVHTVHHVQFIHSVFCLTTGSKPPPKRFLHIVQSSATSFKWECPLLSLRSSSSFLSLLPRLLVTSISLSFLQ